MLALAKGGLSYSPRMRRPFANHGTLVWRWRR